MPLTKIFWDKVLAIVRDENAADIKLDVIALLLRLEKIERCTTKHIRKYKHLQK